MQQRTQNSFDKYLRLMPWTWIVMSNSTQSIKYNCWTRRGKDRSMYSCRHHSFSNITFTEQSINRAKLNTNEQCETKSTSLPTLVKNLQNILQDNTGICLRCSGIYSMAPELHYKFTYLSEGETILTRNLATVIRSFSNA